VSPWLQQQWHDLFKVQPDRPARLTYFTTAGTYVTSASGVSASVTAGVAVDTGVLGTTH
jgi:hypothetical protein